jgi:hypothetical protein
MRKKRANQHASLMYCNRRFRFAFKFPRWWRKYVTTDRPRLYKGEIYLRFLFRYKGKVYEPVFTIIISPFGAKEWRKRYKDSPLTFLGESRGFSYSYILPEELPDAFLKPDGSDYDYKRFGKPIRLNKKIVNAAPEVLKSFRFV